MGCQLRGDEDGGHGGWECRPRGAGKIEADRCRPSWSPIAGSMSPKEPRVAMCSCFRTRPRGYASGR
eukprot:3698362-Heterocapsa_arctica.AAC.1